MTDETCATCAQATKTKRYCAPARCYCGHALCPAFDSWIDLALIEAPVVDSSTERHRDSWANREGASWIDKL